MASRLEEVSLSRELGRRLRRARLQRRKQQTVVAGLAGITTDYLYQIERGLKLPSVAVLVDLARALDLAVSELVDEPPTGGPTAHPPVRSSVPQRDSVAVASLLYTTMTSTPASAEAVPLGDLKCRVGEAWRVWQHSPTRYSDVGALVPTLVTETECALRAADDSVGRRATAGQASDLYGLLRSFCKRTGQIELSLLSADRGIRAAELADDPVRLAAARWNLAHVLLADTRVDGAEDVAMSAAETVKATVDTLDGDAVHGALLLVGAVAAARRRDVASARRRLESARRLADRTGERNVCWTAFGPTNVAMHAASIELLAGHATEGLYLAERVDHRAAVSIERRVAFLLDQAQAWRQRRDNAQVLLLLLAAEREAPEDLRYRPSSHDLVHHLVSRGRRSVAEQAAQLAARLGVAA